MSPIRILIALSVSALVVTYTAALAEEGLTTPPKEPSATGADVGSQNIALDSRAAKIDAYVPYLNDTQRAVTSLDRYASWVNMKTGPTGRERIIYGLVYDTAREEQKAKVALDIKPPLPELDAAVRDFIPKYDMLAPLLTKANGYYDRADYKVDHMVEGRELHKAIVAAAGPFLAARTALEDRMRTEKTQLNVLQLETIERHEGRKIRWHVKNVMMHAESTMNLLDVKSARKVDMPAFDGELAAFGTAVRQMDDYAAVNKGSFMAFASGPDRLLTKLRELDERLSRTKGDLKRAAGLDFTFLVSDYNLMVTTSKMAVDFAS